MRPWTEKPLTHCRPAFTSASAHGDGGTNGSVGSNQPGDWVRLAMLAATWGASDRSGTPGVAREATPLKTSSARWPLCTISITTWVCIDLGRVWWGFSEGLVGRAGCRLRPAPALNRAVMNSSRRCVKQGAVSPRVAAARLGLHSADHLPRVLDVLVNSHFQRGRAELRADEPNLFWVQVLC